MPPFPTKNQKPPSGRNLVPEASAKEGLRVLVHSVSAFLPSLMRLSSEPSAGLLLSYYNECAAVFANRTPYLDSCKRSAASDRVAFLFLRDRLAV